MPYILITHSSVYRHLGRFHFQMIADKIAMNIPLPLKKLNIKGGYKKATFGLGEDLHQPLIRQRSDLQNIQRTQETRH